MSKPNTTSRFSDADIERVNSISIAAVAIERGLVLKKSGREWIGPCPRCGGDDRFAINVAKNIFNCRGCGGKGDVIAFLRWLEGYEFREAVERLIGNRGEVSQCWETNRLPSATKTPENSSSRFPHVRKPPENSTDYDRRQHEKAAWLWSQRRLITGSIAETYLREARGITSPLPPTLAFLPPTKAEHHPAMVAAFAVPEEIEPGILGEPHEVEAVHLTLLKLDGTGKAKLPDDQSPKIIVGRSCLPIVLAPVTDLFGLAITEGIEDALSVHEATGLGTWAAGSAARLPALTDVVPGYIEAVTVFVDDDKAGRKHAPRLAELLRLRGIETTLEGEL
jgi:hypothetical protein